MFNLLGTIKMLSTIGCTILHSHQQCISVLISSHSCLYLLFLVLIMVILVGGKWYLIVVSAYIPKGLMMRIFSCAFRPFVYLLWGNVSTNPLPVFKIFSFCC